MQPLVSIIIPTYNRAHLVGETLDSILAQTHQNWECIVVDDGSTDYTEELLSFYTKRDGRFQYYHRPKYKPKGANACRNYGFEVSKGEYINWFDSDDVMLKNFIELKLSSFTPHIDYIFCSVYYVDEKLNILKEVPLKNEVDLFKNFILLKELVLTPTILFRRTKLNNIDLYNEYINRGQEMEFLSRLLFNLPKEKYKIISTPLFLYRQHEETISGKDIGYVFSYKKSLAYIFASNLKRSFDLKDVTLIKYNFNLLIGLLSEAVQEKHFENLRFIMLSFFQVLYKKNLFVFIQVLCSYSGLYLIGRNSYTIEQYFKKVLPKF